MPVLSRITIDPHRSPSTHPHHRPDLDIVDIIERSRSSRHPDPHLHPMTPDRAHFVGLLSRLVRISSINPAFGDGATSEAEVAAFVAGEMEGLGMETRRLEPEPGRVSVLGRLPGAGGGPSLMLYAHLDTVGVEGMDDPFSGEERDGRVYGRGAYDMKGGLAACLAAVRTLRDAGIRLRGDLLIAAVADEEVASIGMAELLRHATAVAAIVTEPSEMRV
jgi:acetylornithine deacetylase